MPRRFSTSSPANSAPVGRRAGVALLVALEGLLGPIARRPASVGVGAGRVERRLELAHVLLGLGQRRALLFDDILVGARIDPEQHIALLQRDVGLTGTSTTSPRTTGTIGVV